MPKKEKDNLESGERMRHNKTHDVIKESEPNTPEKPKKNKQPKMYETHESIIDSIVPITTTSLPGPVSHKYTWNEHKKIGKTLTTPNSKRSDDEQRPTTESALHTANTDWLRLEKPEGTNHDAGGNKPPSDDSSESSSEKDGWRKKVHFPVSSEKHAEDKPETRHDKNNHEEKVQRVISKHESDHQNEKKHEHVPKSPREEKHMNDYSFTEKHQDGSHKNRKHEENVQRAVSEHERDHKNEKKHDHDVNSHQEEKHVKTMHIGESDSPNMWKERSHTEGRKYAERSHESQESKEKDIGHPSHGGPPLTMSKLNEKIKNEAQHSTWKERGGDYSGSVNFGGSAEKHISGSSDKERFKELKGREWKSR